MIAIVTEEEYAGLAEARKDAEGYLRWHSGEQTAQPTDPE